MKSPAITPLTNKALSFVKEHKLALGVAAVGAAAITTGLLALACVARSEWFQSLNKTNFKLENKKLCDLIDKGDFESCFDELDRLSKAELKSGDDPNQMTISILHMVVSEVNDEKTPMIALKLIDKLAEGLSTESEAGAIRCLDKVISSYFLSVVSEGCYNSSDKELPLTFTFGKSIKALERMLDIFARQKKTADFGFNIQISTIKNTLKKKYSMDAEKYKDATLKEILIAIADGCTCEVEFLNNYDFSKIDGHP